MDPEPTPATGLLDGLSCGLPALRGAQRVTSAAADVGFDWRAPSGPRAKLDEELAELDAAVASGHPDEVLDELGDVLFTVVNLARHLGVDAETALIRATAKFERRFALVERSLAAEGRSPAQVELAELERRWGAAKGAER